MTLDVSIIDSCQMPCRKGSAIQVNFDHYRMMAAIIALEHGIVFFEEGVVSLDKFWPLLDQMRTEGAIVLLQFNGEEGESNRHPYTGILGIPDGEHFRIEADSMEDALAYLVVNYARSQWGFVESLPDA